MGSIPGGAPGVEGYIVPTTPSFAAVTPGIALLQAPFLFGPHDYFALATSLPDAKRIMGSTYLTGYEKIYRVMESFFKACSDGDKSYGQLYLKNISHLTDETDPETYTCTHASTTGLSPTMSGTRLELEARWKGTYANTATGQKPLVVKIQDTELGSANRYDIIIYFGGSEVARYRGYSWDPTDSLCIRDIWSEDGRGVRGDDYVRVAVWDPTKDAPANGTYNFAGGSDGLASLDADDYVGADNAGGATGIYSALELFDDAVSAPTMVLMPYEDMDTAEYEEIITDFVGFMRSNWLTGFCSPPAGSTRTTYLDWGKGGGSYTSKQTTYGELVTSWPHAEPLDADSASLKIPLCGVQAGRLAMVANHPALGLHHTPAGLYLNKGRIDNVVRTLERRVTKSDAAALDPIQLGFARQMNGGIYFDCDWTTVDPANNDLAEISTRNLLCVIARGILNASQIAVHMPNTADTWRMLNRSAEKFMYSYAKAGNFESAEKGIGWYAQFGAPYTTTTDQANRILRGQVGFLPKKSTKIVSVGFEVMQEAGTVSATMGGV